MTLAALTGCRFAEQNANLVMDNQRLGVELEECQHDLKRAEDHATRCEQEKIRLQGDVVGTWPPDLFLPVDLSFAPLTGGEDYDGSPGDDGVTIHLRPVDSDGDTVKAPGIMTVQLLDNSDLENPRVVGVYRFDTPEAVTGAWYGKFGLYHYTLKCPFTEDASLPRSGKLLASVRFVDARIGRELAATIEVEFESGTDKPRSASE